MMILANPCNCKTIFDVLRKWYFVFFPLRPILLLLHDLSSSFILELPNRLEMLFVIDLVIQKIDESGFENR